MRLQPYLLASAVVLVTGCSAVQSQGALPGALASQALMQKTIGPLGSLQRQLLYAAGPGAGVTVYAQRGSRQRKIGSITNGVESPAGLAVDNSENLYVGNLGNSTVTVYPRGSTSPSEVLTGAGKPFAIAVGRDGTVYVANQGHGTPPSGASILEYPKGQKMPSQAIPIAHGSFPKGLALDSAGDLFATIERHLSHSTYQAVYEFASGSSHGKDLDLRRPQDTLTGIATDKRDDLLLADGWQVLVFPPGSKRPTETIDASRYVTQVWDIAINRENDRIWFTADGCTGGGKVLEFSYPGRKIVDMIDDPRDRVGVAVSPALND